MHDPRSPCHVLTLPRRSTRSKKICYPLDPRRGCARSCVCAARWPAPSLLKPSVLPLARSRSKTAAPPSCPKPGGSRSACRCSGSASFTPCAGLFLLVLVLRSGARRLRCAFRRHRTIPAARVGGRLDVAADAGLVSRRRDTRSRRHRAERPYQAGHLFRCARREPFGLLPPPLSFFFSPFFFLAPVSASRHVVPELAARLADRRRFYSAP